tara:strand:- start:129 stop:353 length:225 start_codon:yes stop_codon:yes gene_type:complete
VKYFLFPLILILTNCSLDKNSTYWNESSTIKPIEKNNLSKILKKNDDFKKMTFEEFNVFLEDYSDQSDYPDINN